MSIADYNALMNPTTQQPTSTAASKPTGPQNVVFKGKTNTAQQKYFVRYRYVHRPSCEQSYLVTDYDFINQEVFETWLEGMKSTYLDFDLLVVNKM